MKKTSDLLIITPETKIMTSTYCEVGILNLCRARFGSIRAALHYAASRADINNTLNLTNSKNEQSK